MSESSRQLFWVDEFKKLEWIQSQVEGSYKTDGSNSSWIELPYTTMPGDKIEVKWAFVSLPPNDSTYGIIWGGGDWTGGKWRTLACGVSGRGASIYNGNIGMGTVSSVGSLPGPITTMLNATQKQDPEFPMTMFIQNENSLNYVYDGTFHGYTHQFTAKCWYCKIWRSNELIFDLVPASSNSKVGMVNTIDKAFYTSKSEVKFIGGPAI